MDPRTGAAADLGPVPDPVIGGVVGRLLRTLGFSPQRPVFRASQQDPERVRRWREQDYPAIREQAAQVGAVIYFADEAGIRSDYHSGTTWAPVGKTPVVTSTGARHSVNMISAVTPKGRLRFSVFTGSMTAKVFLEFVRRLLHDEPAPVFLIVDGHPVHRSTAVRLRRPHRWTAAVVPAAALLARAQPR